MTDADSDSRDPSALKPWERDWSSTAAGGSAEAESPGCEAESALTGEAETCGRCGEPIDGDLVMVNVVTFPFAESFGDELNMHAVCAEDLALRIVEQLEAIRAAKHKAFKDAERALGIGHA